MTKISPGSRVLSAYELLREAIGDGSLAPGTRIIETEIADRLGISRSTVRAALHRLLQEGSLCAAGGKRKRLWVRPLTARDFWDLIEVLGELHGLAAERAASMPAPDRRALVSEVRAMNAGLLAALDVPLDRRRIFNLDTQLHERIIAVAGSERIQALARMLQPQLARYEDLYHTMAERAPKAVQEHEEIAAAIEAGDAGRAHSAARVNLARGAQDFATYFLKVGERGHFHADGPAATA